MSYIEQANQTKVAKEKAAELDRLLAARAADEQFVSGQLAGLEQGQRDGYILGTEDASRAFNQYLANNPIQQSTIPVTNTSAFVEGIV